MVILVDLLNLAILVNMVIQVKLVNMVVLVKLVKMDCSDNPKWMLETSCIAWFYLKEQGLSICSRYYEL